MFVQHETLAELLFRPTALSDIVSCAIKRHLPREISGAASRKDARGTLMLFSGCIGTLTKASCVDVLLTASLGGVAGIITGKSWTSALRAYLLITKVLFQDFFQSGAKMYQELSEYLEVVREHPVGRLF